MLLFFITNFIDFYVGDGRENDTKRKKRTKIGHIVMVVFVSTLLPCVEYAFKTVYINSYTKVQSSPTTTLSQKKCNEIATNSYDNIKDVSLFCRFCVTQNQMGLPATIGSKS